MESIVECLTSQDDFEGRLARIFLYTKTFVLDAKVTNRIRIDQLSKAEKTMLGIKFEEMFKLQFGISKSQQLDCLIAGKEVDVKFTCRNNWMIPPKCFDQICLLARMDDEKFSFGIIQATKDSLTKSANWDRKKQICLSGRGNIHWLFKDKQLYT